jgi:rhamnosyltransferase
LARGQFLVFLVQDAVPVDAGWLERLVMSAASVGAAGSYGRELPWPSDNALIKLHMQQALAQGENAVRQHLPKGCGWDELAPWEKFNLATFHDTCSCLNRQIWQEYPYQHLSYGEDLDWGARVIQAGYMLIYEPRATVYHSHDRSSWYEMKRSYADHELVMRLFDLQLFPRIRGLVASWLSTSWQFVRRAYGETGSMMDRIKLMLRAPVLSGARHCGSYLGAWAAKKGVDKGVWQYIDGVMRSGV